MLEILICILLIMWIFGLGSAHTFGGLLHILLVVAIVLVVVRLLRGGVP